MPPVPVNGPWTHIVDRTNAANGLFHGVYETTDVQGARQFLVVYADGSRCVQYYDPRELL